VNVMKERTFEAIGSPVMTPLLHIKNTRFDSVASVVITKVASVACCSQVSQVLGKHTSMMPMSFL
jgi:hypothetical protein